MELAAYVVLDGVDVRSPRSEEAVPPKPEVAAEVPVVMPAALKDVKISVERLDVVISESVGLVSDEAVRITPVDRLTCGIEVGIGPKDRLGRAIKTNTTFSIKTNKWTQQKIPDIKLLVVKPSASEVSSTDKLLDELLVIIKLEELLVGRGP